MKQLTLKILLLIIAAYLASAFIYADFNIGNWSKLYKLFAVIVTGVISTIIISIYYLNKMDKNETI